MRSCQKTLRKFEGDTRKRSDDVMQWEYRWNPDLDVLLSYHQVQWVANRHCRGSQITGTVMEEQVSGSTDSPITIAVESRTTEVTESDRQGKRPKTDVSELVNEPMHLGAGTVLGRRDGFESKSCKSHGGVTNDPEHHDEGDPQHPDESQMKNRTSDESKQAVQLFDALELEVFCKNRFPSQASRWSLYPGCVLVLADEWDMNDKKHAIATEQLRDRFTKSVTGWKLLLAGARAR